MRLLPWVVTDRRFLLLLLNAALALILGFFSFNADQSLNLVIHGGYWAMLVLSALFFRSLWKIVRQASSIWSAWRTAPRWPAILILGCGLLLLAHEKFGFKILMDEAMLLGTSMTMHYEKTAMVPMRANDIHGAFQLLNGQLDKRPLFHPFLVSLLHDFTGYRPENAFVLNAILTFVLLTSAFLVARKLAGRAGGALAVLLLTSLPLLAQNATGGGFELLNLVMILSTLVLAMRFAARRDAESQEAMLLSAVLLSQTRYESVLFLVPVGLLVLWVWWRERRPVLSAVVLFSPLFLLPYALHNKVFSARTSSWELASQPGYDRPFSPAYVFDNLGHALQFFFDTHGEQSNSLVIAVLGFLAAPFFVLWCVKTLRRAADAEPARVALAFFAVGFAAHTALLLCYFWGKFDDPVIRRLSLPLNLALVIGVVAVAAEFRRPAVLRVLIVLTIAGTFGHGLPAMARHDYSLDYYYGREAEWRREFIAAHPERDYLVIDNSSIFWIAHQVSATPTSQSPVHKESILYHYRNHTFSGVYVFQRYDVDDQTGAVTVQRDDDIGPDYQLETYWERRFTPLRLSRISRVVAIKEGPATPPSAPAPPIKSLTKEELEKVRQAHFERFIQRLP